MMQYHDKTWSELPTRMEKYSNGRYYYGATTSGFSYFAVTGKGAGAPTTTPTLTSLATITQQIKSESTTGYYPACHPTGSHETGDYYHHRTTSITGRNHRNFP